MKKAHTFFLSVLGAIFVSSGSAEAYVGYGYRANDKLRTDNCYRSPVWDYAATYYRFGPDRARYARNHHGPRGKNRHHSANCCCEANTKIESLRFK